jgi:hypothetical protein
MKKIIPRCLEDKGDHFVSAEGYWHPCCTISYPNKSYFLTEEFNVLTSNNFHTNPKFLEWVDDKLADYFKAPRACKAKCGCDHIDGQKFYSSSDDAEFFSPEDSTH